MGIWRVACHAPGRQRKERETTQVQKVFEDTWVDKHLNSGTDCSSSHTTTALQCMVVSPSL
eukprot:1142803-Pelagomonas_calceolata.AAC.5